MDNVDLIPMFRPIVAVMLVVLMAMIVDLISGVNKAKQRGDLRTSAGLRRTLSKFIMYEGGLLIAAGVDILIDMSNLLPTFGVQSLHSVPFVTCLVGIFLCAVEFVSLREKADEKAHKGFSTVENIVGKALSNEQLIDLLASAIRKANNKDNDMPRPPYND